MSRYAFPTELPAAEFRTLAAALATGRVFDRSLLLPAWVVQGYAEGMVAGQSGNRVGAAPSSDTLPVEIDDESLAAILDMADKHRVGGLGEAALMALPWRSIALAVAKLVVKILDR